MVRVRASEVSAVSLSLEELKEAAKELEAVSRESQALVKRIEQVTSKLKGKWTGEAMETFYRHHNDWRSLMEGQVAILVGIALELRALAERYEKADI